MPVLEPPYGAEPHFAGTSQAPAGPGLAVHSAQLNFVFFRDFLLMFLSYFQSKLRQKIIILVMILSFIFFLYLYL